MRIALLRPLSLVACLGGLAQAGAAQAPLTLREAITRADGAAFRNRAAAGQHAAQSGAALAPWRGILPTVRVESGVIRTTDPLAAFGFTLQQRLVTAAAFQPDRLNHPEATDNISTGLVLEQPLFNADAWMGRQAARQAARASAAEERWTRARTAVDVVQAYWGAVLAAEQVQAWQQALDAAIAHQRQAESLARQGLVTRADVLLAGVKVGELETGLLSATSDARLARLGLAVLLGEPEDTSIVLPSTLPEAARLDAVEASESGTRETLRGDVEAAAAASAAARADHRRAGALYLPRLNGFGTLAWNSPSTPFSGTSAWTVGLKLSWSPFTGAAELAEQRASGGRLRAAEAMAEGARAQAALEQQQADDRLRVARASLVIAARNVTQATEAHRIMGRKYDGGLATITELLEASAQQTRSALAELTARYVTILALANRRTAYGLDLQPLYVLDP